MIWHMNEPSRADALSAWSTFARAVLTLVLVALAVAAWSTAKRRVAASIGASAAATASAEVARAATDEGVHDGSAHLEASSCLFDGQHQGSAPAGARAGNQLVVSSLVTVSAPQAVVQVGGCRRGAARGRCRCLTALSIHGRIL